MSLLTHIKECSSTNELAMQLALEGAPHGHGVVADRQTRGRGRNKRPWYSDSDNGLWTSIILRPRFPISEFSRISLAAGVAVAEAIEQLIAQSVQLKWPNDIFLANKKCGGILAETSSLTDGSEPFVIVGIGINLCITSDQFPEEIRETATSLYAETSIEVDKLNLYGLIQANLLSLVDLMAHNGFGEILTRWRRRDLLLGKRMNWVTADRQRVKGRGLGVDDSGCYIVESATGEKHQVISGDLNLLI
ncbi:MAG: biotin--[acetyl-CoA-carboxylase] ligase [Thermodesulfobacteriota bacterium]